MENPIKMDDLGVPLFSETPKYCGVKILDWNFSWHLFILSFTVLVILIMVVAEPYENLV